MRLCAQISRQRCLLPCARGISHSTHNSAIVSLGIDARYKTAVTQGVYGVTRNIFNQQGNRFLSSTAVPAKDDAKAPRLSMTYHPYSLAEGSQGQTALSTKGPSPREDRFAVVELSGTQYKVTLDDVITADLMENVDIGDTVNLDKVLLVGTKKATAVGRPYVREAKVIAAVEEIAKDKKVIAFKTRRRKNSKRTKGFRRQLTILRVVDITVEEPIANDL